MESPAPRHVSEILPNVLVLGEPLRLDRINPLYCYLLERDAYGRMDRLDQETRAWGVARQLAERGTTLGDLQQLWDGSQKAREPQRWFFRCLNRLRFGVA